MISDELNLGEKIQYSAYVIRYGKPELYSNYHQTAEDALNHALSGGWDVDKILVVGVKTVRQLVMTGGVSND